jgi:hypothetical protein
VSASAELFAAVEREIADASSLDAVRQILGSLEVLRLQARRKAEALLSALPDNVVRLGGGGQQSDPAEVLTQKDVAALLKVSPRFVRDHPKELGRFPVGRRGVRYRRADVERFITRRQQTTSVAK